jgi:hypothetical protein
MYGLLGRQLGALVAQAFDGPKDGMNSLTGLALGDRERRDIKPGQPVAEPHFGIREYSGEGDRSFRANVTDDFG